MPDEELNETEQHNAKVTSMVSLMQQNGWKFLVEEINTKVDASKEFLTIANPDEILLKQGYIRGLRSVIELAIEMATEQIAEKETT